ncbi:MAG: GNAT superfamily N-acetyltransferase [Candidatus Aldehydirespiratoraceae bacterium]|jgi:GNAT superfamily N-acetyltransferase
MKDASLADVIRFELPLSPDGIEQPLADGGRVLLRPIRSDDAEQLSAGFERLSERSRFLRFFTPMRSLPDGWVDRLSDLDHRTHRAWVAYDPDAPDAAPPGLGVGVARLVEVPGDPTTAEVAFAVTDDYHGRGIGRLLLHIVAGTASASGYAVLAAEVLRENTPMRTLLRELGDPVSVTSDGATVRVEVSLAAADDADVVQGALYDLLRLAATIDPEVNP